MPLPVKDLIEKLHAANAAVPLAVKLDVNYFGLRIDENGQNIYIAKQQFTDGKAGVGEIPGEFDDVLSKTPHFRATLDGLHLGLGAINDRANKSQFYAASAGDRLYTSRLGHNVNPDNENWGTLGWIFYLDDVLVGLSCRHVLCPQGDQTPAESRVGAAACWVYQVVDVNDRSQDKKIGTLLDFDLLDGVLQPVFETALVKFDNIGLASGAFRATPAGPLVAYPSRLGGAETIGPNERYHMIGAVCTEAKTTVFRGVALRKFLQDDGSPRFFAEQLFFDACGHPGDSGAVIVHEADNGVTSVVGLNIGGDGAFAIANPLYQLKWKFKEMRNAGGILMPSLVTT